MDFVPLAAMGKKAIDVALLVCTIQRSTDIVLLVCMK